MAHRTLLHSGPGQNDWLTGTWYRKRWPWTLKSAHDYLKGEDKDLGFGETISIGDIHMTSVTSATKVADPRGKDHSVHWQDQHGQSHYATGFKAAGQDVHWSWSLLTRLPDGRQGSVSRRAVYHIRTILGDKHELEGSSLLYLESEAAKV